MSDLQNQDDAPPTSALMARLRSRRLKSKRGYTLIEILVVLAIIAMLVGLAGPQFLKVQGGAKAKAAGIEVKTLKTGLDTMSLDIGRYPTQAEGLNLLAASPGDGAPNWRGPYITPIPDDPWGHAYVYTPPEMNDGREPKIMSLGEDAKPGGTGNDADVTN
jgi:general secretion pathway protein G